MCDFEAKEDQGMTKNGQFWPREKWHTLRPIFRAVFDSSSLFFAPEPHGNACYAGYIQSGPVTDRKLETRKPRSPHPNPSKLMDQVGLNLKNAYDKNKK